MLHVNQLIGFGVSGDGPPLTITSTSNTFDSTTSATNTMSAVAIGTASPTRYIVVIVAGSSGSNIEFTSLTVAGQACTRVASTNLGQAPTAIFITDAPVTTGTTADLVTTTSVDTIELMAMTFSVTGGVPVLLDILELTGVGSRNGGGIEVSAGGVLCCGFNGGNSGAGTWTGATEVYDGNLYYTAAALNNATGEASRTVSLTWSGSARTIDSFAAASFRSQ